MKRAALSGEIARLLREQGSVVIAIEGPCAAGKSTLGREIAEEFGGRIFHADDYFLRPCQRTPERLREIGGNFDRERFYTEVALPVMQRQAVTYKCYSCSTGTLSQERTVPCAPVTVVEGSYCMHPELGEYYDLGVFLEITPQEQSRRIMERNGEAMHRRFVEEWIPMENSYFNTMGIREKCRFVI